MAWDDLGELADRGWEIGSHTCSHPRLTTCDDDSLAHELVSSRACCEEVLGLPCPYGDVDTRVVAAAAAAGYTSAAALPQRPHEDLPLEWPRVGIYHKDTTARFALKISPAVRRLRHARQSGGL
jgi:peptidoglycan/xylan/chitin deacetylase (PgdA/CDA1 family)